MKIAVTGPAASGKGFLSKRLADVCGLRYIDVGIIFRAVTLLNRIRRMSFCEIVEITSSESICVFNDHVSHLCIWGQRFDYSELSSNQIGEETSVLASSVHWLDLMKIVAESLLDRCDDIVADGRNLGTSIMPDADFVFFIDTSLDVRVRRRYGQGLHKNGLNLMDMKDSILSRDKRDLCRAHDPFVVPTHAIRINNDSDQYDIALDQMIRVIS